MRIAPFAIALSAACLSLPAFAADDAQGFATPQDALDAFIGALSTSDHSALIAIFGPGSRDLLSTGNPDRDAENRADILTLYQEGYRFRPDGDSVTLHLGETGWPFPIPLAKNEGGWHFDIETGRSEILFRRIGLNELETIETLAVYVDIQAEFRLYDHDGDGVMEFAASLLSSGDGARDGLYWGDDDSPLGERLALASLDGYNDGQDDREAEPFGGYYYRVLTGQGPSAPGGEYSYLAGGNMVGGHAFLAVPADYGDTGIHSFMVAENGVIYEADLGEDSLAVAQGIHLFDPDDNWQILE